MGKNCFAACVMLLTVSLLPLGLQGVEYGRTFHASADATGPAAGTADAPTTLPDAVARANGAGDAEILLSAGTYEIEEEVFLGARVHLRGVDGAEATILRRVNLQADVAPNIVQRVLRLDHAEARASGLTITGGSSYNQAGRTAEHIARTSGGGVLIGPNGGTLDACRVIGNRAGRESFGAGVSLLGPAAVVTNCVIQGNYLNGWNGYGAGVYLAAGLVTHSDLLANSNLTANASSGGGAFLDGGTIDHCRLIGNVNPSGSDANWGSDGCKGGGLFIQGNGSLAKNCLIAGNEAYVYGGGLHLAGGLVLHCTIVGNKAGRLGGGVCVKTSKRDSLVGCIVSGNRTTEDLKGEPDISFHDTPNIVVRHCLSPHPFPDKGEEDGNITAAPLFRDFARGDFSLGPCSPAIDAGPTNGYEEVRGETDLAGSERLVGEAADIGAYEYKGDRLDGAILAPEDALAGAAATFDATAFTPVPGAEIAYRWDFGDGSATTSEKSPSHLFEEPGTYPVRLRVNDGSSSFETSTDFFVGVPSIEVIDPARNPGHVPTPPYATPGMAATSIAEALRWAANGTVITVGPGDHACPEEVVLDKAIALVSADGPAKTILRATGTPAPAGGKETVVRRVLRLDHPGARAEGFTITGGSVFAAFFNNTFRDEAAGGGVLVERGTLSRCIVTNNVIRGLSRGGGIAVLNGGTASRCQIVGNTIYGWTKRGGGVYLSAGGRIVDSEIRANKIETGGYPFGAGAYLRGGTMSRCVIAGNSMPLNATADKRLGAGLATMRNGTYPTTPNPLVENCLICGNLQGDRGGGVYSEGGDFVNCTIVGNESKTGGGVYSQKSSRYHNCLIQGNTAPHDTTTGAPEWNGAPGLFTSSLAPVPFPESGEGNVTAKAIFEAGTYELSAGSPGYDAGTIGEDAWLAAPGATDLAGNDRVQGDGIDIGAYEYTAEGLACSIASSRLPALVGATCTFTAKAIDMTGGTLSYRWTIDGVVAGTAEVLPVAFASAGRHHVGLTVSSSLGAEATAELEADIRPGDLYVIDPQGSPGHLPAEPYDSREKAATNILDAARLAIAGSTIHVGPGTHQIADTVEIGDDIRLVGEAGARKTLVRRAGGDKGPFFRVLHVNSQGAVVEGLTLENGLLNTQQGRGAGLLLDSRGGLVRDCVISNNTLRANMYTYGAGVFVKAGTLQRCLVVCNTNQTQTTTYASAYGGGLVAEGGIVRECVIAGNRIVPWGNGTISAAGGGAFLAGGTLLNCLVTNNASDGCNGGVAGGDDERRALSSLTNCTIVANHAKVAGSPGAGLAFAGAPLEAVNTIVWGNDADGEPSEIGYRLATGPDEDQATAVCVILHCFSSSSSLAPWPGHGNRIGDDPGFRDLPAGDLVPRLDSPCRDSGLVADWMTDSTDLAGNPRLDRREVDIGCYETPYRTPALFLILR